MPRVTLAEIAAMPFPDSLAAVRRHYDPDWGRFEAGEPREIAVTIDYKVTLEQSFTIKVMASSAGEAEKEARAALKDDQGDVDIVYVRLSDPIEQMERLHPAFNFAGCA